MPIRPCRGSPARNATPIGTSSGAICASAAESSATLPRRALVAATCCDVSAIWARNTVVRPAASGLLDLEGAEELADERLELGQRQHLVLGIERGLIPLVREELGLRKPRLSAVALAQVARHAEVLVVVAPLEVLMGQHDLVH